MEQAPKALSIRFLKILSISNDLITHFSNITVFTQKMFCYPSFLHLLLHQQQNSLFLYEISFYRKVHFTILKNKI